MAEIEKPLKSNNMAEVVEDRVTGRVVHGGDAEVAAALVSVLGDPAGLAAMRIAARARAQRFSVVAAADRYVELFSSVLGGSARP